MPVLRSPFAGVDLPAGDPDPEYLYFLEHIRLDGDSYSLELSAHGDSPASLIQYEAPLVSSSDGECVSDPSPGRLSSNRRAVEERESSESASLETAPAWYDSLDDVDEDYRRFLQHTSLVNGQLVLEIGGAVINYEEQVAAGYRGKKDTQRGEEAAFASLGEGVNVAAGSDEVASGARARARAPATVVPEQYACDWRADPSPRSEVNDGGDEGLSDANTLKGAHRVRKASSSDGRRARAGHPTNSGGKVEKELGIIWPTHITRRPDSDFKRRLIKALTKPVAPKEFYRLFDVVTTRTPLMKLRQVRNETKLYPAEEMGKSYLEHYPDLADQIMKSGSRNGLALMRGFLFWLQNTVHEDQFKPWVDDFKEQEVVCLVD